MRQVTLQNMVLGQKRLFFCRVFEVVVWRVEKDVPAELHLPPQITGKIGGLARQQLYLAFGGDIEVSYYLFLDA